MNKDIYVLTGENTFELEKYFKELLEEIQGENINLNSEVNFIEFIDNLNTQSLFSEKTVYISSYEYIFKDFSEEEVDNYLSNPSPFSKGIIIIKGKIDGRKKCYKYFKKRGMIKEFNLKKGYELEKFTKESIWATGYDMDNEGLYFLIEVCAGNQNSIQSEIDKIAIHGFPNKRIIKKDIEKLVTDNATSNIFMLLDNIFERDEKKIVESLNTLFRLREPEIKILFMIIREYKLILLTKYLKQRKMNHKDIISVLEIHPFSFGKISSRVNRYTFDYLRKKLYSLYDLEEKLKRGRGNSKILLMASLLNI